MIPWLAVVRIAPRTGRPVRLWLPVILLWIVLSPFALLLAPLAMIYGAAIGRNPFEPLILAVRLFWSLSGFRLDVRQPASSVHIALY